LREEEEEQALLWPESITKIAMKKTFNIKIHIFEWSC